MVVGRAVPFRDVMMKMMKTALCLVIVTLHTTPCVPMAIAAGVLNCWATSLRAAQGARVDQQAEVAEVAGVAGGLVGSTGKGEATVQADVCVAQGPRG